MGGSDPVAEGDQTASVKDGTGTVTVEPGLEWHLVGMNQSTAFVASLLGQEDQLRAVCTFPGQQDPTLFEKLPKSPYAVNMVVPMPFDASVRDWPILLVDVPTGEDVRRRERGRSLDTVKEQDLQGR